MASAAGQRHPAGPFVGSYGHVPNGARVYYLQRSQPPLLTLMMDRYVSHTNDTAFLRWAPRPPAAPHAPYPGPPRAGLRAWAWAEVGPGSCPRDNIGTLALELDFWTQNRTVSVSSGGKSYVLNHYAVPYGGPR